MRPEVQVLLGPLCKAFGVCAGRGPGPAAREKLVKKLLMLAAAAIGAQYAMKRRKGQDSREVWKQATR
jgi:hypothetical protein